MAQFRATIQGQRGQASRLGSKKSGLRAAVNGWNIGVIVIAYYDETKKEDMIEIGLTGGSKDQSILRSLEVFSKEETTVT